MHPQDYRSPAPVEPEPIDPQTELARLGPLHSVHAAPPLHHALSGPIAISALVAIVGALCEVPLPILAPIAVACLGLLAWSPLRTRGRSVGLHARGLLVGHAGTQRPVAFEDVDEVWFEINRLHSEAGAYLRALRIADFSGGVHLVPTATSDGEVLADVVLRACSEPLLREAGRALQEGQALTFGNVKVDRNGITLSGRRAAWGEFRLAVVSRGELQLYRRSLLVWRTVRLDRVPNPGVFVGLVTRRARSTRIDDPLIARLLGASVPLAVTTSSVREAALRTMIRGGLLCMAGVIVTVATHSSSVGIIAWGPIIFGSFRFVQGLVALWRRPR